MEWEVKLKLSELDRLREVEERYDTLLKWGLVERVWYWEDKEITLLYIPSTVTKRLKKRHDERITYWKDLVDEKNTEILRLKKRPKRCILF